MGTKLLNRLIQEKVSGYPSLSVWHEDLHSRVLDQTRVAEAAEWLLLPGFFPAIVLRATRAELTAAQRYVVHSQADGGDMAEDVHRMFMRHLLVLQFEREWRNHNPLLHRRV